MTDTPPDPYKSARDLPSVVEMTEQLRGFKTLTVFIGREQRSAIRKIEGKLNDLVQTIDGFYERLGERHRVFHESLNTEAVKKLIPMEPEDAEQALIAHYREADTLRSMLHRLRRFPAMRTRLPMIERAQEDYEAEHFDSVVLKLLAVMDGFVNAGTTWASVAPTELSCRASGRRPRMRSMSCTGTESFWTAAWHKVDTLITSDNPILSKADKLRDLGIEAQSPAAFAVNL